MALVLHLTRVFGQGCKFRGDFGAIWRNLGELTKFSERLIKILVIEANVAPFPGVPRCLSSLLQGIHTHPIPVFHIGDGLAITRVFAKLQWGRSVNFRQRGGNEICKSG